jgi:alkylated DNA nucleotide flippase Atl1
MQFALAAVGTYGAWAFLTSKNSAPHQQGEIQTTQVDENEALPYSLVIRDGQLATHQRILNRFRSYLQAAL